VYCELSRLADFIGVPVQPAMDKARSSDAAIFDFMFIRVDPYYSPKQMRLGGAL
jgi:hypothetical protein